MVKKALVGLLALTLGVNLSHFNAQAPIKNIQGETMENRVENQIEKASVTITVGDFAEFLKTKKAHYPLSDEFVEKYQQKSGGYIELAENLNLLVDKEQHEPNQKWHYFTSWLDGKILEHEKDPSKAPFLTMNAKSSSYSNFLCPELLLWIFEASGADPDLVRQAKDIAEKGKVEKTDLRTVSAQMRALVTWDMIQANVLEFLNSK